MFQFSWPIIVLYIQKYRRKIKSVIDVYILWDITILLNLLQFCFNIYCFVKYIYYSFSFISDLEA